MVVAQKFTFQYNRLEDRLKMLINYDSVTARMDFFITRAMLFRLIPVIEQLLIKCSETSPKPHHEFSNLHVNSSLPTATQHQTDTTTLELLDTQTALLLEKVDLTWHADVRGVRLLFYANGKAECQAMLSAKHFADVVHGMIRVVPHTSWGMAPNILEI